MTSRVLDQLSSHLSIIYSLQDLMEVTLDLDTKYHEREKEKNYVQERKTEASKSDYSCYQNSLSSNQKKKSFHFKKRDNLHSSFLNKDFKLMGSEKERIVKEVLAYDYPLEELQDEEEDPEEIETFRKVLPSSYHHYLDLFSKVKADKLPPNCACDDHIELDVSLPTIGVIYSLSNQESDKFRA
ncbi:hypothetical protein O181_008567 [Austropuccinia psidii MF-1]|uniref:Uncharacterized protein n=1 Tax=Austropuccinia psidii MF-1 TaxID=1389203 RepID=A0A9Q3GJI0_9BASI|nr:hypothetical protein [Austropuccinia psidii MF-1]